MIGRVPLDHEDRLSEVLQRSWGIFVSRFLGGRHNLATEAPFQHHFAAVISAVGALYCIAPDDVFLVDLETRLDRTQGRPKYLDITCGFSNAQIQAAVELKFKTRRQGAEDHGRIDMYVDIQALEHARASGYSLARFFMITDNKAYLRPSRRGVGTVFTTCHGHVCTPGLPLTSTSVGREGIVVTPAAPYRFDWVEDEGWAFLHLSV
jgi:hypothetical protein